MPIPAEEMQCNSLKKDSISIFGAAVMGICGAGPGLVLCGIFGLLLTYAKSGLSLAMVLATLLIFLIALSYISLAKKYNSCGGNFAYINSALGPKMGTWGAIMYIIVCVCSAGQPPAIFNTYLNNFIAIPAYITMFLFVVPMAYIAMRGVEINTKILVIIWLIQMALLLWPPIALLMMSPTEMDLALSVERAFTPPTDLLLYSNAVLLWVWSMVGFELPAFMGEELRGGSSAVGKAIAWTLVGLCATFVFFAWLYTAIMTPEIAEKAAGSDDALALMCKLLNYTLGSQAVSAAAMVSCWASALAFYSLMPRFLYDLGRKGVLPDFFTTLNNKRLPKFGIIAYAVMAMAAYLYDSYAYVDGYLDGINDSFTMQAIAACVIYILICLSNIKDEYRNSSTGLSFIKGRLIPSFCILAVLYLIYSSGFKYLLITSVWMIFGVIFVWLRYKRLTPGASL